jgi:siroheme decarboxylase
MTPKRPADTIDLLLLNALQNDLPLTKNPWEIIGNQIGISEAEVLHRLNVMTESGILRGIGPVFESAKRGGGVSTLVALQVPEEKIASVAAMVNEYQEVSHNFSRSGEYNLWFTLAAGTESRIHEIIQEILTRTGIPPDAMLNLKTIRRYKIDVIFPLILAANGGCDGHC